MPLPDCLPGQGKSGLRFLAPCRFYAPGCTADFKGNFSYLNPFSNLQMYGNSPIPISV
jgi:hypothetical protein